MPGGKRKCLFLLVRCNWSRRKFSKSAVLMRPILESAQRVAADISKACSDEKVFIVTLLPTNLLDFLLTDS